MSAPKSRQEKMSMQILQNSVYGSFGTDILQDRMYHNFFFPSLKNVEEITVAGREHLAKLKEQMEPIKLEQNS